MTETSVIVLFVIVGLLVHSACNFESIHTAVVRPCMGRGKGRVIPVTHIECVHMTSRRPCRRSKQRNGGHVGGVKYIYTNSSFCFIMQIWLLVI